MICLPSLALQILVKCYTLTVGEFGHAVRSQECINSVMDMEVELDDGCRSAGRPRKTWRECVRRDITDCSMESVDPLDRVGWRSAVKSSELLLFQGIRKRARNSLLVPFFFPAAV